MRSGLRLGQVVVQIHCGSRGLGHQVATDYIEQFQRASRTATAIELPDRQLVCAPLDSPEGQSYLAAMNCAANYAWANRQVLTYRIREAFEEVLGGKVRELGSVPGVRCGPQHGEGRDAHGRAAKRSACASIGRAPRAPSGRAIPDVPADYRAVGQPVLVPGSMGTASYVLVGTAASMDAHLWLLLSRRRPGDEPLRGQAPGARRDSCATSWSTTASSSAPAAWPGLAEEAPQAYKDVDRVVAVVEAAGLARIVARLEPLAVIKG